MDMIEVYVDGACSGNPGLAGCGIFIKKGSGAIKMSFFLGNATNNIAEYVALLIALDELKTKRKFPIVIYSDSELLVRQLTGEYKVKDKKLKILYNRIIELVASFSSLEIKHIKREGNKTADALARKAIALSRLVG